MFKKLTAKVLIFSMLASLSLMLVACGGSSDKPEEETYLMRLGHPMAPGDIVTIGYEKFKELLEAKTDGKVKVEIYGNTILGSDRVTMESAQKGDLELSSSSSPNMANFGNAFMAFDLPYITQPKYAAALHESLDNGAIGDYLRKVANDINLEPIMYSEFGYRNFASVKEPFTDLKSFANVKVRTTNSPVEVAVADVLGMSATPIAWGETYTALQQGTVDAEGNTYSLLYSAKHNEVLKSFIDSEHNYSLHLLMMNKAYWDTLPADIQAAVREAAAEAITFQRAIAEEKQEEAKNKFIIEGVTIYKMTPEERAAMIETTRPVWNKFNDTIPQDLVELILQTQTDEALAAVTATPNETEK